MGRYVSGAVALSARRSQPCLPGAATRYYTKPPPKFDELPEDLVRLIALVKAAVSAYPGRVTRRCRIASHGVLAQPSFALPEFA